MTEGNMTRLDSYPFDSKFDGYDDYGYPIFDRAVASGILRGVFRQFFTDGVFGSPADNLEISRGEGLTLHIARGVGILDGGMGGVFAEEGMDVVLADEVRGIHCYSVFLRLDDNDDHRSTYINVVDEVGQSTPAQPESNPGIRELRLGYVVVPSGATDLTDAVIVDERGTAVCPYAAPFEEIDVSDVVRSVKEQAGTQYERFMAYLSQNKEYLDAAIDGSLAGQLIARLNDVADVNKNIKVDDVTIHKGPLNELYAAPDENGVFGDYFMFKKSFVDSYVNGIEATAVIAQTASSINTQSLNRKDDYVAAFGGAFFLTSTSSNPITARVMKTNNDGTTEETTKSLASGYTSGYFKTSPVVGNERISYVLGSASGSGGNSTYNATATSILSIKYNVVTVTIDGAVNVESYDYSLRVEQSSSYTFSNYTGYAGWFHPVRVGDGSVMGGSVLDVGAASGVALQRCAVVKITPDGVVTSNTATGKRQSYLNNSAALRTPKAYNQGLLCQAQMSGTSSTVYFGFESDLDLNMTVYDEQQGPLSAWVTSSPNRKGTTQTYDAGVVTTTEYVSKSEWEDTTNNVGDKVQPFSPYHDIGIGMYRELPSGNFVVAGENGVFAATDWGPFRVVKKLTDGLEVIKPENAVPSEYSSEKVAGYYSELFSDGKEAVAVFVDERD